MSKDLYLGLIGCTVHIMKGGLNIWPWKELGCSDLNLCMSRLSQPVFTVSHIWERKGHPGFLGFKKGPKS